MRKSLGGSTSMTSVTTFMLLQGHQDDLPMTQSSLVFVNTLMIQRVLTDPAWPNPMGTRDLAALSPLIYDLEGAWKGARTTRKS